ncbi:hypothetical protein NHX12_018343 [Muraenolepis orangiensis]|uniref:Uncharacterized protein n=1 Tax=Muraenolepis orangiensis TaxID=630683 RepID=A0A9Q0IYH0_9TELE|nr:hypothetical protein NHX12_018343 [Muraenolepis orangiensis]
MGDKGECEWEPRGESEKCLLKCLMVYPGEDGNNLIKEYLVVQKDEVEMELERCAMAVFVFREEEDPLQPPHDIGINIEGVEVMNQLPSIARACAMLFVFIYALNLSYPSQLKYMFDALQKLFMGVEPKQITPKVCSPECQAVSIE